MNKLNILYEDNHIIVVIKQPNILSQSDITGDIDMLSLVKNYIKEKYNKPGNVYVGLVHRLDRVVGGIMVFAKTSKAAKRLNEQIRNHEFNKTYLVLLDGKIKPGTAKLTNYLYKDEKKKIGHVVDKTHINAKLSELTYELISYINNKSLVKVNLITGRYHQIRLQFSNINHPIFGDKKYGKKSYDDIHLYAYKLEFTHPTLKKRMTFKNLPNWKELKNETIIHRL